jgi:hypothetical protein
MFLCFVYLLNNHCHRVTTQLQLINIIIIKLLSAPQVDVDYGSLCVAAASQSEP